MIQTKIMRKLKILACILIIGTFTSCDVLEQFVKMSNLAKCEFRLYSIKNLTLAGINVQNIKSMSNLGVMDAAKLSTAYLNKSLPLTFTLNVQAKNPNSAPAGMNRFEWILAIDNQDLLNGAVAQNVNIGANGGVATIPLSISLDLVKLYKNQSLENLAKLVFNLSGQNDTPNRITMKIKPTIYVNNVAIQYPDYINVSTNFTSN